MSLRVIHATRRVRLRGVHQWHPTTLVCMVCGVNQRQNAAKDSYGYPCKGQAAFVEVPFTHYYLVDDYAGYSASRRL